MRADVATGKLQFHTCKLCEYTMQQAPVQSLN